MKRTRNWCIFLAVCGGLVLLTAPLHLMGQQKREYAAHLRDMTAKLRSYNDAAEKNRTELDRALKELDATLKKLESTIARVQELGKEI